MNNKINFTIKTLENLPLPENGKRFYFRDTKLNGLELMVTHNGTKSFKVYKKHEGKPVRVTLGKYPDLSVENARKKAQKVIAGFFEGINPNEEKRKVRDECTFKELFDRYINEYAKPNGNRSWQDDVQDVNRNLKHWMNKKISSIKKDEIARLHAKFGSDRGIHGANRLLDRINAIYNKAIEWGWDGENPAKGIKKFKTQSRERFLKLNELNALFESLSKEENPFAKDYILISLLTGARKGNVLTMRWNDIDFNDKVWNIPTTKNGDPLSIPLVPKAIEVLKSRKKENINIRYGKKEYVFLGTGKEGHLADPKKAWNRIRQEATVTLWTKDKELVNLIKEAKKQLPENPSISTLYESIIKLADKKGIHLSNGIMDVRIHDLRRTLGSWQAATGATTAIIGKSLGHKSQKATAIYARLDIDPIRGSIEKAADAMFSQQNLEGQND